MIYIVTGRKISLVEIYKISLKHRKKGLVFERVSRNIWKRYKYSEWYREKNNSGKEGLRVMCEVRWTVSWRGR
jgi:hypothetical protein